MNIHTEMPRKSSENAAAVRKRADLAKLKQKGITQISLLVPIASKSWFQATAKRLRDGGGLPNEAPPEPQVVERIVYRPQVIEKIVEVEKIVEKVVHKPKFYPYVPGWVWGTLPLFGFVLALILMAVVPMW
jgi:isopentenyldiphosphate isomerase